MEKNKKISGRIRAYVDVFSSRFGGRIVEYVDDEKCNEIEEFIHSWPHGLSLYSGGKVLFGSITSIFGLDAILTGIPENIVIYQKWEKGWVLAGFIDDEDE